MKTTFSNIHFSDVRKVRNASLPAVPSASIHTSNTKKSGELRRKRSEYGHTDKWHNTWYWAMRGTDTNTRHRRTEARTVTVNPFELVTPLRPDTIAEEAELQLKDMRCSICLLLDCFNVDAGYIHVVLGTFRPFSQRNSPRVMLYCSALRRSGPPPVHSVLATKLGRAS